MESMSFQTVMDNIHFLSENMTPISVDEYVRLYNDFASKQESIIVGGYSISQTSLCENCGGIVPERLNLEKII